MYGRFTYVIFMIVIVIKDSLELKLTTVEEFNALNSKELTADKSVLLNAEDSTAVPNTTEDSATVPNTTKGLSVSVLSAPSALCQPTAVRKPKRGVRFALQADALVFDEDNRGVSYPSHVSRRNSFMVLLENFAVRYSQKHHSTGNKYCVTIYKFSFLNVFCFIFNYYRYNGRHGASSCRL